MLLNRKLEFLPWGALLVLLLLLPRPCHGEKEVEPEEAPGSTLLEIVGERNAVIVLPNQPNGSSHQAGLEIQEMIRRSTGTSLEVLSHQEWKDQEKDGRVAIHVGNPEIASEVGIDVKSLAPESYHLKSQGTNLVIIGHDAVRRSSSLSTLWGVQHLLDRYLGVRWLWPGDLGTYVPTREELALPQLDETGQPPLQLRNFRTMQRRSEDPADHLVDQETDDRLRREMEAWLTAHQEGSRARFRFGHAFRHWWERYSEEHPEYFAEPIDGFEQPWPRPDRIKLRVGNPEVVDRIIQEWEEAGKPDYWNVCPNDGSGFCVSEESRALDLPADQPLEEIWRGQAKLTTRYVRFWNQLLERMREKNPNATLSTYAYSAYRDPPPEGVRLLPDVVLGVVHAFDAYEPWRGWRENEAQMVLRPNWGHMGMDAPHLPLGEVGEFLRFTLENGLIGFDYSRMIGYWATQGPMYYLVARQVARPDLEVEEIIEEWCSAFGAAACKIREYLEYWEEYARKTAYPIPAGGVVEPSRTGLYAQVVEEHGLSRNPIRGSWEVLPHLYPNEVLAPARRILRQARELVPDDPEALDRIRFLTDGLVQLALTRDTVEAGFLAETDPETYQEQFTERAQALAELRRRLTPTHAVWGENQYLWETRRGIPTRLSKQPLIQEDLEGL